MKRYFLEILFILLIANLFSCFGINIFAQEIEWKKINKDSISVYNDLVEDINGNLYFHNYSNIYKSADSGFIWQNCTPQLDALYIQALNTNKGIIYIGGTSGSGKYFLQAMSLYSSDMGKSWKDLGAGIVNKFAFDASGNIWATVSPWGNYVYGNILKLPKDSTNWISPKNFGQYTYSYCIFVDNKNNVIANAGFYKYSGYQESPDNLWRSSDFGKTWTGTIFNASDVLIAKDIKQSGNGYLYLLNSLNGSRISLVRSKDNGNNWETISMDDPDFPNDVTSLVIDKNDNLIAGTPNQGILYSSDYGDTWHKMNSGLGSGIVSSLLISKSGYIYAGINNVGLYRSSIPLNSTGVNPNPVTDFTYRLDQNYPNPFNPTTKILYSIPESLNVKLTVYDMLGKEVSVLVNEYKSAGSYSVNFNAYSLPSGIYVYTIQLGQFRESKKLVLLR